MSATDRHNLHTQEGKNRTFKKPSDQLVLVDLTPEEKAQRELYKKLNFFPTPMWATRALIEAVSLTFGCYSPLFKRAKCVRILEPACGQLHIVNALHSEFFKVTASDIHDFGTGYPVQNFLTHDYGEEQFDVVIMNPPFSSDDDKAREPTIADKFIAKALTLAPEVFVFGRLAYLTPSIRHELMSEHLSVIYVFCERVPIALGRISKKSGATDYAWYHFSREKRASASTIRTVLIPPGTRDRLTRHGDDRA